MTKILGICGSPKKKNSTTHFALQKALEACAEEGFDTEIIALSQYTFGGCQDCGACRKKLSCSQKDDFTEQLIPKLDAPEVSGIIFASPVYFGGITGQLKSFIDRTVIFRRNGFRFADKVAGALTVGHARNGGQELSALEIAKAAMVHGMVVVPDAAPSSHFGANLWSGHPDAVEGDQAGIATAVNLGKNMAKHARR